MKYFLIAGIFIASLFGAHVAHAATLSLQPSSGTFSVGSIFEISLYLDTQGATVNAIEALLQFSPDKLQVVSPAAGQSIIDLWVGQPRYNNSNGTIELRGGIPKGVNVTEGVVSRLRFRVKGTGTTAIKFSDKSRVLLHDGKGTDALNQTYNAVFELVLPPPAGPIVVSETHPDQSKWYSNNTVVLIWEETTGVEGYSYVLNKEPVDIPDNTSQGIVNGVTYRELSDGQYYLHLKALRNGSWGGVTHFAIQIDTAPPAEFPLEIFPSDRSIERQPTITFKTTDKHSGINRYEIKLVPLEKSHVTVKEYQPFFFQAESPYVSSPLQLGSYDVIVRTYDNAENFRDTTARLQIVTPLFQVIAEDGIEVRGFGIIPWIWFWSILILIIILFLLAGWFFKKKYLVLDRESGVRRLPHAINDQLSELKKYQRKYGKLIVLIAIGSLTLAAFATDTVFAQRPEFSPPVVTNFSRNIANDEIFYVGGVTELPGTEVILYIQNKGTGELRSQSTVSNERGEWFYRHDTFFSPGEYLLWTQSRRAEEVSAPSAQTQFSVSRSAFEIGATKVSYEVVALIVSILLVTLLIVAGSYMVLHARRVRRKHKEFQKEIREAEESIRRGFAVLKRDIQAELAIVKRAGLGKELSKEQHVQEEQLLKDLAWAESYIGKEVWDIAETEHQD